MAKILVLCTFSIMPPYGGTRSRVFQFCRTLRDLGHEVHFGLVAGEPKPTTWSDLEAEFGPTKTHHVPHTQERLSYILGSFYSKAVRKVRRALGLRSQYIRSIDDRPLDGFKAGLEALQHAQAFSHVLVEFVYLSKLLTFFPRDVRKIIDTHDVYGNRHLKMGRQGKRYEGLSFTSRDETRALCRADTVIAISKPDEEHFASLSGASSYEVVTVGHIIEAKRDLAPRPEMSGIFLGGINAGNLDTLEFLLNDIVPKVVECLPDFRFLIGGEIAKTVRDQSNVGVLGTTEDLADLLEQASLFLTPTRIGTGMAIKLLDALAAGMPVVTSMTGARGHAPETMDAMCIIKDGDATSFANAVIALSKSKERRLRLEALSRGAVAKWNDRQIASLVALLG